MTKTYLAKFAPSGVVSNHGTRLTERTFRAQRGLTSLPVYVEHETETVEVGRVSLLTYANGWWQGDVSIFDGADTYVRSGQSLSIAYDATETYVDDDGVSVDAVGTITEVSLVRTPAFAGAELVRLTGSPALNRERLASEGILAREAAPIDFPGHTWVDAHVLTRSELVPIKGHEWVA